MKKLILLPALLLPLTLFAKIWIVDSNPGSASKDFVNLQEAHDGASAGDTLYLIGSGVSYITTKVTINKRLIIIGPGYFLNNPETQVSLAAAFLRLATDPCNVGVEFAVGSEGSVLMGTQHAGSISILTNDIMIKRNLFYGNGESCSPHFRIRISGSSVSILQNYVAPNQGSTSIQVNPGYNTIRINNNFLQTAVFDVVNSSGSSGELVNNNFAGLVKADNTLVQNNIFLIPPGFANTFNNCVVRNNITTGNTLPSGDGNILLVPQANIFVGTGTIDGQWKLKDDSPAIGTGFEGVDMGMFGGDEPYVLSGIPPIPTIYQLNAPAVGEKNTGLPITIKAKSNN